MAALGVFKNIAGPNASSDRRPQLRPSINKCQDYSPGLPARMAPRAEQANQIARLRNLASRRPKSLTPNFFGKFLAAFIITKVIRQP